jgi:competence protein ComEC
MPSGDKKIEYVVASHPDADHIGGLESVVESYNVGEFIETNADSSSNTFKGLQSALEQKKVKTVRASTGDKFNFATGAEGEVLWPKSDVSGLSSNDASIVLKFDYKGATALFTGDAELEAQNGVLAKHSADKIKTEVYKVPHHGSGGALDLKFLEAVVPKYAVVSVGKNNSYGHPAQTVLDALGKVKAQIFRTDQEGTIDFATNGASWTKRE